MTSLLWLFGLTAIGLLLFLVWAVWKELGEVTDLPMFEGLKEG